MRHELILLSDEVWARLWARFEGLTNDEYYWEPAPGCWSVRIDGAQRARAEWPLPRPEPEPFTTIAWRMWHLTDMYGENRAPRWLGVEPQGDPIGLDDPEGEPAATADAALELLDRAHDRWNAHLALVDDDILSEAIGPVGGGYADRRRTSYVLHMLDEFIHHGAEISLLRDLWRWQHPLGVEANTERAMRGDLSLADEVDQLEPADASELMRVAAAYARWDLVTDLVGRGAPVPTDGQTPLHLAAGAGELDLVRLLIDQGADPDAHDPVFHAKPLDWARFLRQRHVVAWFESRADE